MKNFIYSIACAIMVLMINVPTTQAAFPVSEKIAVENTVTASIAAPAKYETRPAKTPERMQRGGRGATAAGAGFGIAAIACGALGLLVAAIPLGICAIVFGVIGLNRRLQGLAIAGIILGALDVIIGIIIVSSMMQ